MKAVESIKKITKV